MGRLRRHCWSIGRGCRADRSALQVAPRDWSGMVCTPCETAPATPRPRSASRTETNRRREGASAYTSRPTCSRLNWARTAGSCSGPLRISPSIARVRKRAVREDGCPHFAGFPPRRCARVDALRPTTLASAASGEPNADCIRVGEQVTPFAQVAQPSAAPALGTPLGGRSAWIPGIERRSSPAARNGCLLPRCPQYSQR